MTQNMKHNQSDDIVVYQGIRDTFAKARTKAYVAINSAMVEAYWDVGRQIEESVGDRAEYGKGLLRYLSGQLTEEFGKGFDENSLRRMRQFYNTFPIRATLWHELSWSHYRLLMKIEDASRREFYVRECVESAWTVRQLERQINSFFYERLLATQKSGRESVRREIQSLEPRTAPDYILKDPYILEFLDLKEKQDYHESDLEQAPRPDKVVVTLRAVLKAGGLTSTALLLSSAFVVSCANPPVSVTEHPEREKLRAALVQKVYMEGWILEDKSQEQTLLADIAKNDKDAEVRSAAADQLTDQAVLEELARNDADYSVRYAAIYTLTNQTVLAELARNDAVSDIRQAAIWRLKDPALLMDIVRHDKDEWVRFTATGHLVILDNQTFLADIAKNHSDKRVRKLAIRALADQTILADIAKNEDEDGHVRGSAAARLEDRALLEALAKNDRDWLVRYEAVSRLDNQTLLADIARNDANNDVRKKAVLMLDDQALLAEFARNDKDDDVRREALRHLKDQALLAAFIKSDVSKEMRDLALGNLCDQAFLAEFAKNSKDSDTRQKATRQLTDPALLADIAKNDERESVRRVAEERLKGWHGIPNASWEPIFFESINTLSEKINWRPLRETGVPSGSLEVRVWMGFGLSPLEGVRLCRHNGEWTGFYTNEGYFRVQEVFQNKHLLNKKQSAIYESLYKESKPVYELTPKTSWASLWDKVEALGILTLPDSSVLPNEAGVLDGISYVVEIHDGVRYRTYEYGNPQFQEWPEAKKMIEIINTLQDECWDSLPEKER